MVNKVYKGYELIKEIAEGNIKNGTKIIPHYPNNDCTVEYFEYYYGFLHAYYKDINHSDNDVNVCVFLDNNRTFELIEYQTIDIDSIEEIDTTKTFNYTMQQVFEWNNEMEVKINQTIRAVKHLNKELQSIKK